MMIIMILNAVTTTLFKKYIAVVLFLFISRSSTSKLFFLSLVLLEITEIVSFYNFGAKIQIIREIFVEKYFLPEN